MKKQFLIGQIALLLFFLLQIPARLYPAFHPDLVDFIRGFLLGIAIVLLLVMGARRQCTNFLRFRM